MAMECDSFRLSISRYLDDDLSETGIEQLLQHLSGCSRCRQELKSFERMRSWFEVADSYVPLPEPREEFSLSKLLTGERVLEDSRERGEEPPAAQPHSATRGASGRRNQGFVWAASLGRFLFPAGGHRVWRYALPLLLVAALGIWWIQGRLTEDVDVHELLLSQSLVTSSYSLNDPVDSNLVYLIQHAAEQPMAQYGDEAPMIRQASVGGGN